MTPYDFASGERMTIAVQTRGCDPRRSGNQANWEVADSSA